MFWKDHPKISEVEGMEVAFKNPGRERLPLKDYEKAEAIRTIEKLGEDEYAVIEGYELLPYKPRKLRNDGRKTYRAAEFMKKGSELKIRVVDKPARSHIESELKRFNFDWPKRGYKWTNPRNRTSIFVPLTSLIDGAKLFSLSLGEERIEVRGHGRTAWVEVPSRTGGEKHRVVYNPLPGPGGRNWYDFKAFCDCGERVYYGNASTKYVNNEFFMCPHGVAGYYETARLFHETDGNEPVPQIFPGPREKTLKFDKNLGRTFVKESYKRRLSKAERELLICGYQGLEKDCFSFNLHQGWEKKI